MVDVKAVQVIELPLDKIVLSGNNPRQYFDEKKMEDLKSSVKEKGVVIPITVRQLNGKYEIVCGERRFRASKDLKRSTIPAIVSTLDDNQALEFMVIENLQREDINAMDEARGYDAMVKKCKYTIGDLATKVGKSLSYISTRIKLLQLPKEAQDAITKDVLTPGHGIVLLRLGDRDAQARMLKIMLRDKLSVRASENQLEEFGRSLSNAAFDTKPCTKCEFNGSQQRELFDKDTRLKSRCLRPQCYDGKVAAEINRKRTELMKKGFKVVSGDKIEDRYSTTELDASRRGELKKLYTEKCKNGCENFVYSIESDYNDRPKIVERCLNSRCYHSLTRQASSSAGGSDRSKEMENAKKANRVREARRAFYIKKLLESKDPFVKSVITTDIMLEEMGIDAANKIVPFKSNGSWGRQWSIRKLYGLKEDDLANLRARVVIEKTKILHDTDLKLLNENIGVRIDKEFIITEDYLKAHTEGQLIKLAKEIGLTDYIKKTHDGQICTKDKGNYSVDGMDIMKKHHLVELFLETKGFNLKGRVPKEIA